MWLCKNQVTSCSVLELFYCCTNVYRNMHGATSTTEAAWWVDMVFVRFPCCGSDGHDVFGIKAPFPPVKNCCLTKILHQFLYKHPPKIPVLELSSTVAGSFSSLCRCRKIASCPRREVLAIKKVHRVDWELQHPGRLCTARTIISHPIITFALRMQESFCVHMITYVHIITLTLALSITHHLEKLYIYLRCHYTRPSLSTFHFCYIEVDQSQTSLWNRQPYWPLMPSANEVRKVHESMGFWLDRVLIEPRKFLPESSYCYVISWIFKGCWLNKKGGFTVEDIISEKGIATGPIFVSVKKKKLPSNDEPCCPRRKDSVLLRGAVFR